MSMHLWKPSVDALQTVASRFNAWLKDYLLSQSRASVASVVCGNCSPGTESKWRTIGRDLGHSEDHLFKIASSSHSNGHCLLRVLEDWEEGNVTDSSDYNNLVPVLMESGEDQLAGALKVAIQFQDPRWVFTGAKLFIAASFEKALRTPVAVVVCNNCSPATKSKWRSIGHDLGQSDEFFTPIPSSAYDNDCRLLRVLDDWEEGNVGNPSDYNNLVAVLLKSNESQLASALKGAILKQHTAAGCYSVSMRSRIAESLTEALRKPFFLKSTVAPVVRTHCSYPGQWCKVGDSLGVKKAELEAIAHACEYNDKDCLEMLIHYWIGFQKDPACINNLTVALKDSGEECLANNLAAVDLRGLQEADKLQHESTDVLSENAVPEIMAEIRDASDVWFQIGVELKLRMETLEAIRQRNPSNEDCLRELLREWLKTPDLQHTWAELIRALRSKTVRKIDLANDLERTHCPDPGGGKVLIVNDLGTVLEATLPARRKWYNLGLSLKVPVETLDGIRSRFQDDEACMREMLKHVSSTSQCHVGDLVSALRRVGEYEVADSLEKKLLSAQDSAGCSSQQTGTDGDKALSDTDHTSVPNGVVDDDVSEPRPKKPRMDDGSETPAISDRDCNLRERSQHQHLPPGATLPGPVPPSLIHDSTPSDPGEEDTNHQSHYHYTVIYGQQNNYGNVTQNQHGSGVMYGGGAQHMPDQTQSHGGCQQAVHQQNWGKQDCSLGPEMPTHEDHRGDRGQQGFSPNYFGWQGRHREWSLPQQYRSSHGVSCNY